MAVNRLKTPGNGWMRRRKNNSANSANIANSASTFECGGENPKTPWQSWQSTGAMMTQIDEIRQCISLIALAEEAGAKFSDVHRLQSRCPFPRHAGVRSSL